MAGNEKDCTWIDKCNIGEEEEEEPQDVMYPVLKGVLEELAMEVQVAEDRL